MDERDDYGYGWSPAGERVDGLKSGRRQGRVKMIAGYRGRQLLAPFTVEGACNRTVFEIWLATCLVPLLKPGEWVIGQYVRRGERWHDPESRLTPVGAWATNTFQTPLDYTYRPQ
jgi:hypothetical protein